MTMIMSTCASFWFAVNALWFAFFQLLWGLIDQTHYHYKAFKLHIQIAFNIVYHYAKSIPRHFHAHMAHQYYLCKLGFGGQNDLIDTGSIVWQKSDSKDNQLLKPVTSNTTCGITIERITGMTGNKSGNPAHVSLASLSLQQLWVTLSKLDNFNMRNTIFIDFGCGTGLAVLSAMTQPFHTIIGIELDKHTSDIAIENLMKFKHSKRGVQLCKCDNVSIICDDMRDFDFTAISTSSASECMTSVIDNNGSRDIHHDIGSNDNRMTTFQSTKGTTIATSHTTTVVLYLYEPLWTLSKEQAHDIYTQVFLNARICEHEVIVAYFDCGLFSGNALSALTSMNATLIHKSKAHSLEFGTDGYMWIYKL